MDRRGVLFVVRAAYCVGMVLSQTTLAPAVVSTTLSENVATLSVTPVTLSSTTPGCAVFNTSSCESCPPGSQYDNNTLMCSCCPDLGQCLFPGACLPCNKGSYQPLTGQQRCWPCDRGFYANLTGSPLCNPCPPGSFNNNTGGDNCTSCSPGFFSPHQSSTSCTPCLLGTFCNENTCGVQGRTNGSCPVCFSSGPSSSTGCTQCHTCPGGKEALQTAAKDCTPCRPGMHKPVHQTLCQICSSGFFQTRWGQESCDICPENHYCPSPDVSPILCPSDAFCPEGSLAPSYCMETFFRKAGDTCEFAPVTIALLVIGSGVALLFIILMVVRRRKDTNGDLSASRSPLLHKERPQGRYYGIPCDAEPVYAGW